MRGSRARSGKAFVFLHAQRFELYLIFSTINKVNDMIRGRDELFWIRYKGCTGTGSKGKREMLVVGKPLKLPVREARGEPRKKVIMETREQCCEEEVVVYPGLVHQKSLSLSTL